MSPKKPRSLIVRRSLIGRRSLIARSVVAITAALAALALAGCATGFSAPTRLAIANLQATSVKVTPNLLIDGLIVALPDGNKEQTGGTAYIQFTATNMSGEPDELVTASAEAVPLQFTSASASAPASASQTAGSPAASQSASPTSVASQTLPVGDTVVPAKTSVAPGSARIVVALTPLTQDLWQGQSVRVSLKFQNAGSVSDVVVPVIGSEAVGSSFLPSSPPASS